MERPAVSIIMAAYDAGACIGRAIDSVVAQTVTGWELIVVDDASTDDTVAVVADRARADPRIRLLRQPRNAGPAAARNRAIEAARGDWVTILDADDAYKPERLARLLDAAEAGKAGFAADNLVFYDLEAGREAGLAYHWRTEAPTSLTAFAMLTSEMGRRTALGFLKPLISRAFLLQSGIRYTEAFRYAEDFTFYTELLLAGIKAILVPDATYIYTQQSGAMSGRRSSLSHTVYTPFTRVAIAQVLEERHGAAMSPAERAMLSRFRTWSATYAHAHAMSEHKNAGRLLAMAGLMRRQPRAALRFILAQKPLRHLFGTGL